MKIKDAIVARLIELCAQRNIRKNELANLAGLTPSTVYSVFDESRRDIGMVTVKKLCDGLEITVTDFFDSPLFKELEQEME
ncbi:MAG: helix-turn-helix transcriptional regulator [Ruminococcaceae bacterium]|nr:helix-turn-helix transcriptional regulator [Oscillospiraceae bacterium]